MDRQEYKILLDEIMALSAEERFAEAAQIADQIDWRKVRKSGTLVQIGDLYRSNFRYEDALDIMLLAYEKNSGSRKIIYNVCELYIEVGDVVGALDFLAKYRQLAPNATEAYILQYKILELEHADIDTKITLLKELCHKDRTRPEWRYQLAYLLHRAGYATECVEECDKMITWFHNGPFVIKAMELKMLHARLTAAQQEIYNARGEISDEISAYESDEYTVEKPDPILGEEDFHVKTIDMGKFNTINLQKALAESMRELLSDEDPAQNNARVTGEIMRPMTEDDYMSTGEMENAGYTTEELEQYPEDGGYPEEPYPEDAYPEDVYPEDPSGQNPGFVEEDEDSTVFIDTNTVNQMTGPVHSLPEEDPSKSPAAKVEENEVFFEDRTSDIIIDSPPKGTNPAYESLHQIAEEVRREEGAALHSAGAIGGAAAGAVAGAAAAAGAVAAAAVSSETMGDPMVEKDITGQINLDDYMADWEQRKAKKAEERKQETARKIKENTGKIFAEYDQKRKNGLIGEIEKEHKEFTQKYEEDDIELRSVGEVAADNAAHVVQMQTGTLGFVDAAVASAEDLILEANEQGYVSEEEYDREEASSAAEPATEEAVTAEETETAEADPEEAAADAQESRDGEAEEDTVSQSDSETGEAEENIPEYAEEDYSGEETAEAEDGAEEVYEEDGYYAEDEAYAESDDGYQEDEVYAEDDNGEVYPEEDGAKGMSTAQMEEIAGALEADADRIGVETVDEMNDEYVSDGEEADFSPEEKKLFNDFLYSKKMRAQILNTIDNISLAPYVGNVIITGDSPSELLQLGKVIVKELQMIDSNFISKRVAKISGTKMNERDIPAMLSQLVNGALLVERAADMVRETVEILMDALEGMQEGIIVILMDEKREMELMIDESPMLEGYFNTRIDITPMNNNALVEYAKKYAYSREYKIDEERGILALHQRISQLQIGEHHVTTREVEDIIEEAISRTSRPKLSTFFAVLGGKRYDYEDMIILREEDFV